MSVDVDTELAVEAPLLPVCDGTAMEKLEACLDALHPSYQLHQPTFTNDKNSKFVINMGKVKDFVGATLLAECRHSGDESKPAAMYCCGPPGVGKTSGISWCCKQAVESWDEDEGPTPILCEMNASEKSWDATLKELGSALGMKTKITESRVYGKLRSGKQPLLFVVDEIDSFLSGKGSNSKTEGLSKMLEWANDTEIHFALIGISNSMNDEKAFEIQDAGEVCWFSVYTAKCTFRLSFSHITTFCNRFNSLLKLSCLVPTAKPRSLAFLKPALGTRLSTPECSRSAPRKLRRPAATFAKR